MNDFAKDICDLLISKTVSSGFGTTTAWSCFAENEPTSPIKCITVYKVSSIQRNVLTENTGYFFTFQVRVRASNYTDSITRANLINDAIGFLLSETINTKVYKNIIANSVPLKINTDQKNRVIHVQNFSAEYND